MKTLMVERLRPSLFSNDCDFSTRQDLCFDIANMDKHTSRGKRISLAPSRSDMLHEEVTQTLHLIRLKVGIVQRVGV